MSHLQVQTIFDPLEKLSGLEDRAQLRFEARSIMAMALQGVHPLEMNAFLDESCSASQDKIRMLEVLSVRSEKNGSLAVEFRIIRGSNKGAIFSMTIFDADMDILSSESEKFRIEKIKKDNIFLPGEGSIARGDMDKLAGILRKRITEGRGRVKSSSRLPGNVFDEETAKLEELTAFSILSAAEKETVYRAVSAIRECDKVRFEAIVLYPDNNTERPEAWLLGFDSRALKFRDYLQDVFKDHTLGYTDQALSVMEGAARLEYLLHEPLCGLVGHYRAREIQEKLFDSSNYDRIYGKQGRKNGSAGKILRRIIEAYAYGTNRVYINADINEKGVRGSGTLIASAKTKRGVAKAVEEYPDCVIEDVKLGGSGELIFNGRTYWRQKTGYSNKRVTLKIRDRLVVEVYGPDGERIYPAESSYVYAAAAMGKDGKRKGGRLVGKAEDKKKILDILEEYPDCIVENVELNNEGGLILGNRIYWGNYAEYRGAQVTLVIKAGQVTEVYDGKGTKIYPSPYNHVYVNAVLGKNGKRKGGEFAGSAQDKRGLNVLLKVKSDYVVEKVLLNSAGGLNFNGEIFWRSKEGYEGRTVTIAVRDDVVREIFDEEGSRLYPYGINNVYLGGRISRRGRVTGGMFLISAENKKALNNVIKKHPDCIIKDLELDASGGLALTGKIYWHTWEGHAKEKVTAVVEGGEVKEIYNEKGEKIYPMEGNRVYAGARIGKDGKIKGGNIVGTARDKFGLNVLINRYPDCIIENVELDKEGGLKCNARQVWRKMKGYEKAKVTLLIEKGFVKEVYDNTGRKIYPFGNIRVYTGASVGKDGKRKGGRLAATVRDRAGLNSLLGKYPEFLAEDVELDQRGGLKFNGKVVWRTMKDHRSEKINIVVRQGKLKEAYDRTGRKIYPSAVNHVYTGAVIEDGKRKGGKLILAVKDKRGLTSALSEYPDCIVENVPLNKNGRFSFGGQKYWQYKQGYKEGDLVTVRISSGVVVEVYDSSGNRIYQSSSDRAIEIFNRLWEKGDLEKLMTVFGAEGTNRILLKFFDCFTPKELLGLNDKFLRSISRRKRDRIQDRKKYPLKPRQMLGSLASIGLFIDEDVRGGQSILTEELIKQIYLHLVRDSHFLEQLEKQQENRRISPFLRRAYKEAVDHYLSLGKFEPQGIQRSTELKFYQKMGIKFILDKKKALLADEPGLGKTLQALGAAVNAYDGKGAEKVLIVCPNTSKESVWKKQIDRHLRGEQEVFIVNKRNALDSVTGQNKAKDSRFIVVNYELIRGKDGKHLREGIKDLAPDFIIADEAHQMRGESYTADAVMDFDAPYKVLVTGTPLVGRKPSKLYNLLNWMYPERYPDKKEFNRIFNIKEGSIRHLRDEMKNYMIRRYMSDVMAEMSGLNIQIRPVRMGKQQAELYRQIEKNIYEDDTVPMIAQLGTLKRAAIDTALVRRIRFTELETGIEREVGTGAHGIVIDKVKYGVIAGENGDFQLVYSTQKGRQEKTIHDGEVVTLRGKKYKIDMKRRRSYSAKYDQLDGIVDEVVGGKREKLVVFTGVVRALKDMEARYSAKGYKVRILHGDIPRTRREKIINGFNETDEPEIFICTYQTAGESIDLTGANNGVLLDEPWTVQEKDQILRRLYRLGQDKEVTFYILQAEKTIDERIEEVLAEGDFLQKIILDDPAWTYNTQSEIIEKFMRESGNGAKDRNMLKNLQKKTRPSIFEDDKTVRGKPVFEKYGENGQTVSFSEGRFTASFINDDGHRITVTGIREFLDSAGALSKKKSIFREFFKERFSSETDAGIRVKDMILWQICTELIPGFKHIDYHGKLELVVETGTYILKRIIDDPGLELRTLREELEGIPSKLFDETLYYLDSSNIFKFFSMIDVIPQTYYYEGRLLKYTPPISIYYDQNGIQYFDEKIVDNIAPGWRVPEAAIPEAFTGFERDSRRSRTFTRPEEVRLAHQLELGNKAAEVALVMSYLKKIPPVARRVKRRLSELFGEDAAGALEENELLDIGRVELVSLIRRYAELGAYERYSLGEYMKKRLNPRIYSAAFREIKHIFELNVDAGVYGSGEEGEPTLGDITSGGDETTSGLDEQETISIMRSVMIQEGFSESEADIVIDYIYGGYTAEELFESLYEEDEDTEKTVQEIEELIEKFRGLMVRIGIDGMRSILAGDLDPADAFRKGFISKGDSSSLVDKLRKEIEKAMSSERQDLFVEHEWMAREIEELEEVIGRADLANDEKEMVRRAVRDLLRYGKIQFTALVSETISSGGEKDQWLLGFNSLAPPFRGQLEDIFPAPVIGYSKEALSRFRGHVLLEYLLHEPLCLIAGHKKARGIQEKIFRDSNYKGVEGNPGEKRGKLSAALRGLIEKRVGRGGGPDRSDLFRAKVREIHRANRDLLTRARPELERYLPGGNAGDSGGKIYFEISTSLISGAQDIRQGIEILAYLMLLCRGLDNVNFIIEDMPALASQKELPPYLSRAIDNSDSPSEIIEKLFLEINEQALLLGSEEPEKLEEDLKGRVFGPGDIDLRDNMGQDIVRIPVISKQFAEWVRDKGICLKEDQYPVVLEGAPYEVDGGVALPDLESAVTVGLAKAALVFARKRLLRREKGASDEFRILKDKILVKLNELYGILRIHDGAGPVTVKVLEYMIDEVSTHRLNRAIDLYLPAIDRVSVDMLKELHGFSREFLYSL